MLDLDTIAVFLEVAKTKSITAASINLRMTQPGVSQKIKKLEGYLGESLFLRKRSGMFLNDTGKEFLDISSNIKIDLEHLNYWIMNKQDRIQGHIHVTTISGFISYVFPKFLKIFLSKYPGIKVTIDVNVSTFVEDAVLSGKSDLGIMIGKCKRESLKIKRLCANRVYMVCSPDYFLAKKNKITKKDLEKACILMHADRNSRTVKIISRKLGFTSEKDLGDIFLIDMEACKAHALEGLGVAFVANMYILDELKKNKLVRVADFEISRPANLISRNEKYESPLVKAFKKELTAYCKTLMH